MSIPSSVHVNARSRQNPFMSILSSRRHPLHLNIQLASMFPLCQGKGCNLATEGSPGTTDSRPNVSISCKWTWQLDVLTQLEVPTGIHSEIFRPSVLCNVLTFWHSLQYTLELRVFCTDLFVCLLQPTFCYSLKNALEYRGLVCLTQRFDTV